MSDIEFKIDMSAEGFRVIVYTNSARLDCRRHMFVERELKNIPEKLLQIICDDFHLKNPNKDNDKPVKQCATCVYKHHSSCRRFPPVANCKVGDFRYPQVFDEDWCGEWQGKND